MLNSILQHAQIKLVTTQGEKDLSIEQLSTELSSSPKCLITGFQDSSIETCHAGILLAEQLGAYCDPWISKTTRIWQTSWTRESWATCTWGEVTQRADFLLCWNATLNDSPLTCFNQELLTSKHAVTWSISSGESKIKLIPHHQTSMNIEDQLLLLRLLKAENGDYPLPFAEKLLEKLKIANYPVIIWGNDWAGADPYFSRELIQAQLRWVRDASLKYRLHHLSLRASSGSMNFAAVANWLTGNASGLSFQHNQLMSDPQFYSSDRLIHDHEVTSIFWIGNLPPEVKTFILSQNMTLYKLTLPTVSIESGTFIRDDGVPIHLHSSQLSLAPALNLLKSQLSQSCHQLKKDSDLNRTGSSSSGLIIT